MVELTFRGGFCLNKEDGNFEAKSYTTGIPESLWESYSAFANTSGGTIALGLNESDDGSLAVCGVPNADSIRDDMWSTLNNPQKVSVNLLMDGDLRVMEVDGRRLIVMDVPAADRTFRPVYIRNVNSGTFKRNGSRDYHCNASEIAAMYRDASPESRDTFVARDSELGDLSSESIEAFRNMMLVRSPTSEWLSQPLDEFLRLIGAARMDKGTMRPTNAGLMMFGKDYAIMPEIPGFFLDYREYAGDGDEWVLRRCSGSPNWSGNLFDFYIFVTNRIPSMVGTGFSVPDGINREDDTQMIRALREVVTNALVHADYWGRGGTVLEMRPGSFTARNPGTFRIPLEEAEAGGTSDPRNRALFKMFNLIGRAERAGSGIRSVINACRNQGLSMPVIEEMQRPDAVRVTLDFRRKPGTELVEGIIGVIRSNPRASIVSIAESLGVSKSPVVSNLKKMKEDGIIERVGGTRGYWRIR